MTIDSTPTSTAPTTAPTRPTRPLVVTADDGLLDDVLRLAAAAGTDVDVAHDAGSARSSWPTVPMVVIGDDQAAGLAHLAPVRRSDVYLVGRHDDDASIWQQAVQLGAERVLFLPADEAWLADRLADVAEGECREALVIGVVGGRGGAGASVFATVLALTASRQVANVMLVDLDPLGGGLDLVLGAERTSGLRWPDLADSRGRLNARSLRTQLPHPHGVTVLSWDRGDPVAASAEALHSVLAAARRACDVVVLDLPRAPDPTLDEALCACASVTVVVPAEVRAVASAARTVARLRRAAQDIRLVSRGSSPSGLRGTDIANALGLPHVAHMPDERSLADQLDRGDTPGVHERGPLVTAARTVLDTLIADHPVAA